MNFTVKFLLAFVIGLLACIMFARLAHGAPRKTWTEMRFTPKAYKALQKDLDDCHRPGVFCDFIPGYIDIIWGGPAEINWRRCTKRELKGTYYPSKDVRCRTRPVLSPGDLVGGGDDRYWVRKFPQDIPICQKGEVLIVHFTNDAPKEYACIPDPETPKTWCQLIQKENPELQGVCWSD